MKLLFVLSHELYLRNFAGVIEGLANKGHDIDITFTVPRYAQDPALHELVSSSPNINLINCPVRKDWWWPVVDVTRVLKDYIHSLGPAFEKAPKIRERSGRRVPGILKGLLSRLGSGPGGRRFLNGILDRIEWSLPCERGVISWLRDLNPDAVLVSPLIDMNYAQTEVLKATKLLALVSCCPVASWDNLTMKGRIQIIPDQLIVWNKFQIEEAVDLHGVNRTDIIATGAQLYDQWFEMSTSQSRKTFCDMVGGLDPSKPIILYTGSSHFICPDELEFFEQWYKRLRADPSLCLTNILIRPHPLHAAQWSRFEKDNSGEGVVVIWPRDGEMPISRNQKQRYFNCLWHSNAIVGINTSVFLEAGILGRSIHTVENDYFEESQQGTLHFSYIANSGLLKIAADLDRHMNNLRQALDRPQDNQKIQLPFIKEFLRPNGLKNPATKYVIDAIEQLVAVQTTPRGYAPLARVCRILIWPLALIIRPQYLTRIKKTEP